MRVDRSRAARLPALPLWSVGLRRALPLRSAPLLSPHYSSQNFMPGYSTRRCHLLFPLQARSTRYVAGHTHASAALLHQRLPFVPKHTFALPESHTTRLFVTPGWTYYHLYLTLPHPAPSPPGVRGPRPGVR